VSKLEWGLLSPSNGHHHKTHNIGARVDRTYRPTFIGETTKDHQLVDIGVPSST
jgi:hypothetical protein